jgi:uracil-DNA glycosylase family 4
MSLELDERRLAMLGEMGIRVFAPPPQAQPHEPQAAPEVAAVTPVRAAPPAPAIEAPRARTDVPVVQRVRPVGVEAMDWDALQQAVAACGACKLCEGRSNTVFGVGDPRPDWMVIGEAPGEHEDLQGEPFVGQAGKLLDNMLKAVGVARGRGVYIANVLKCRPPGNRNPEPDEVAQCEPFLRRQVELLQPRIILAMGRFAVQSLLQSQEPVGKLRGRVHRYNGVPLVVTYHPAYLLRNLPDKAKAWQDLVLAKSLLEA